MKVKNIKKEAVIETKHSICCNG